MALSNKDAGLLKQDKKKCKNENWFLQQTHPHSEFVQDTLGHDQRNYCSYERQKVCRSTLTLEILIPPSFFLPLFTAA